MSAADDPRALEAIAREVFGECPLTMSEAGRLASRILAALRALPGEGVPVKRYVVDRGRLEIWGNRVVFGIEDRRNWRVVPLMPIEVEHEPHKGIWMLILEREGFKPAPPEEVKG